MDINKYLKIIESINYDVEYLINEREATSSEKISLNKIENDINRVSNWLNSKTKKQYTNIEITFPREVKLSKRAKSEKIERTLKGDMYFEVISGNDDLGFINVRTKSFPNNLALRIYYNKLKIRQESDYDVALIYNRQGNFLSGSPKESEKKKISMKIRKLI